MTNWPFPIINGVRTKESEKVIKDSKKRIPKAKPTEEEFGRAPF